MHEYKASLDLAHACSLSYLEQIAERAVAPSRGAVEGLKAFDEPLPAQQCDPTQTLSLLNASGSPATLATQGSRFFGLVVGGALPVTVGAQWIAATWDQLALSEATSPVAVKLESIAGRWVLDLVDLPRQSSVSFVTGTTMGHLTCLTAARQELLRRKGYDLRACGLRSAPKVRIVVSGEIHVSALKVLSLLGFGDDEIERVPVDNQGRLIASALPTLDDLTIVCCQAGNVNSGAYDPFNEICDKAGKVGAWVHVDGAFGFWVRASSSLRSVAAGMDRADSWTTDTHKWLNTPWDCGLAICRHPNVVKAAMSSQAAAYLEIGGVTNPMDIVPELGRRARGIEVWAALRTLGRQGVEELVERCCAHARAFRDGLKELDFEILNDVVLNQVVVTLPSPQDVSAIIAYVQEAGECWMGPTNWQGRAAFRVSVSSWRTTDEDVTRSLRAIGDAKRAIFQRAQAKPALK